MKKEEKENLIKTSYRNRKYKKRFFLNIFINEFISNNNKKNYIHNLSLNVRITNK